MRRTIHAVAVALATALLATACTGTSDPDNRSDIDAKAYYEEYEEGEYDGQTLMGGSDQAESAPQPDARSPEGTDKVVPCEDCQPPPRRIVPPTIEEQNIFRDAGTNPAVDPAKQPRSTFGLDVDTGSYQIGKHMLGEGILPPKDSIRPEEWVNSFDYSDDAPRNADLGIAAESAASTTSPTQLHRVAVGAREVSDKDRPAAALTFVVDTSGSMDIRERLGLVKSSLALLTKNLRPDDRIGIVTYDEEARSVLKPTRVSDSEKILDAIDSLEPGGGTNLEAGLKRGYEHAADYSDDVGINSVILASDGVANIGTTGPDSLANKVNDAAADKDIHLVTVGYGMGNYNDDVMEQLANQGQGFYSYVSTFDEAKGLFADELTSTLTVVARDAKAQVRFDPQLVDSYRLVGYENRALSAKDFDDDSVDAGEVGAGMDVTALYEVAPSKQAKTGAQIGSATVRWRSASDDSQQQASTRLQMPATSDGQPEGLRLAAGVAELASLLKNHQNTGALNPRLRELRETAGDLESDGVSGAGELRTLVSEAMDARPSEPSDAW